MRDRAVKRRRCCDWFGTKHSDIHPVSGFTEQRIQEDRMNNNNDEELAIQLQNQYFSAQNLQIIEEPIITITIDSAIPIEDVKWVDFAPTNDQDKFIYMFNCPVCLRYFNYILCGKCCGNYLCHNCANDFVKMAHKNKDFCSKCPMCGNSELHLEDVNLNAEIKRYGNTFFNPNEVSNKESKYNISHNEMKVLGNSDMNAMSININNKNLSMKLPQQKDMLLESGVPRLDIEDSCNQRDFDASSNAYNKMHDDDVSDHSINNRAGIDEEEESKGGSLKPKSFKTPQKSKQSLNLDSVNYRETFSEEKEKQMIEFALKNESDSRGYIKNF